MLSIVIVSYNTAEATLACINSLISQHKKEFNDGVFELILVDNASTDASASVISNFKYQISNFKLIENKENLGFSKGCNIGAKSAKGKYILFLNSDTLIKDRGVADMVAFLQEHQDVTVLGGKLIGEDGAVQKSVGNFYNLFNVILSTFSSPRFFASHYAPSGEKPMQVDWVMGALMMVSFDVFEKLHGFDEHFFMYVEDMELCVRAKKLGYKVYWYPKVSVKHAEHGSSNRAFAIYQINRGLLYYFHKHKSGFEYTLLRGVLVAKSLIALCVGIATNNVYLLEAYKLKGL